MYIYHIEVLIQLSYSSYTHKFSWALTDLILGESSTDRSLTDLLTKNMTTNH